VLSDVSETELLNRRLDALERYNENIVQSINSALLVVDEAGVITFANPTAGHILGCASAALIGRRVADWFSTSLGGPSLISQTLQEGVRFKGAETMIRLDTGAALPIGISCTALVDHEGHTHGAVAIFQDLSEIKQLQQQVLQQEKMASIGQLAAGVAHEINNPMGFIHANLYQMSEYLEDIGCYLDSVDQLRSAVETHDAGRIEAAARTLGLDFLPLARERYELVVPRRWLSDPRVEHLLATLATPRLRARIAALPGYDSSASGEQREVVAVASP